MKNYILIGTILILLFTIGYLIYDNINKPSPSGTNQNNVDQTVVDVKLEVTAPFSTASIFISNTGNVFYEESSSDTGVDKQTDSIKISQTEFQELVNLLNEKNFWSFDKKYMDEDIMDASTYIVTVRSFPASQDPTLSFPGSYSVMCYSECSDDIVDVINKIKEIWGKEILEVGI